ncbi:Wzz/FepE/Etk N-terminal domain-containing protein [Limnochorda pilosa]|uniref:Polysaccharide chain length determinant N-terminal domain-containing protein n=1 Tax=Limnochorda pilosa TaxID=1555112 RepID=A0A0K2SN56_LIMPI|nr:Wzz/FepE/Etk N-terminal domain-containing protein [Limnochorda pilosa]BAS28249.1 hypothetical protein LIP_2408 [Limnochorda pilosa]
MPDNAERYDDEIDLRAYLEVLWRRKWVVITLVLLAAVASLVVTRSMEPVYQAEATVLIRADSPGLAVMNLQKSGTVLSVETALEMLQSRQLAQAAAEDLAASGGASDLPGAPAGTDAGLKDRVSARRVGNTPMLRVQAEAVSPAAAAALANAMVRALEQAMMGATRDDLKAAGAFTAAQLERVRQDLAGLEARAATGEEPRGGDAEMQRERRVLEDLYGNLLRQQEEIRMRLAVQSSPVQVIDAAVPPQAPVRPRLSLNLAVAVVLAGFAGLALAFALEFFDVRLRSPRELEEILGAPLLAQVPEEMVSEPTASEGVGAAHGGRARAWGEGAAGGAQVERGLVGRGAPAGTLQPADGYGLPSSQRAVTGEGRGRES